MTSTVWMLPSLEISFRKTLSQESGRQCKPEGACRVCEPTYVWCVRCVRKHKRSESLTGSKRCQARVVVATCSFGVVGHLLVKCIGYGLAVFVVVVEVAHLVRHKLSVIHRR